MGRIFRWVAVWLAHVGLWLVYTSQVSTWEILVGAAAAGLATFGAAMLHRLKLVKFNPTFRHLAESRRIPWYAVSGTWELLEGLSKQLFTKNGAASFLAAVPFEVGSDNPDCTGRRAPRRGADHNLEPWSQAMNVWLWAATAMLLALVPAMAVCFRGPAEDRLAGLEMAGVLVTLEMVLLVQGFHRIPFYDLPLTLAFLSFGGGMVFARFFERWL